MHRAAGHRRRLLKAPHPRFRKLDQGARPRRGVPASFACPPDCGWCCTHLRRDVPADEAEATDDFRAMLRSLGVYHCADEVTLGLSLSSAEADAFRALAHERGLALDLHPRTFLLETRRRVAVVLDWHFPYEACAFYKDFRCTAYEARPLVCRAFPVMAPSPRWALAPQCPKTEETLALREAGEVRFGTYLKVEGRARRALEHANAALDEQAMRILETPGARFATGLDPQEAHARLARYRVLSPEAFDARTARSAQ